MQRYSLEAILLIEAAAVIGRLRTSETRAQAPQKGAPVAYHHAGMGGACSHHVTFQKKPESWILK
jgi:hypothetical protein